MRRQVSALMIATLVVAEFFVPGCGQEAAEPAATLATVSGAVQVNGQVAKAGLPLKKGDRITVEKDGLARVQFPDGSRILVFYDPQRSKDGIFEIGARREAKGIKAMLVKLTSGICTFLVPPKRKAPLRFEIEATSSITAIHGTEGKIAVQDGGDLVALRSGTVEVTPTAGGEPITLKAGQQVTIPAGDKPPQRPLPYNFLAPSEQQFFKVKLPDLKSF